MTSTASNIEETSGVRCPVCGTIMFEIHCKARCKGCGYLVDCSDW